MIEPFWGEFLVSPIPMDTNLPKCSNGCCYCFANLRSEAREPDIGGILRQVQRLWESDTYVAYLVREGYPVGFCNRSDPFCGRNTEAMLALARAFVECGIPVSLATKGGPGAFRALEFLPPGGWYITVAFLDEALRERVEPGAPPIRERLRLMETLRSRGHDVMCGVNPCVPEWLTDPEALARALASVGVERAWVEPIHLNAKQQGRLAPAEAAALGQGLLGRIKGGQCQEGDREHVLRTRAALTAAGLAVYTTCQPNASTVWDGARRVYRRTFPTLQDWVNQLHEQCQAGKMVAFQEFADFFLPGLPAGKWPVNGYLKVGSWRGQKVAHSLTFRQLLWVLWNDPKRMASPANLPCFAYAAHDGAPVVDDEGLPKMVWLPEGTDEYWAEV